MIEKTVGIIGCGNMGEALLAGLLKRNIVQERNITVSEKRKEQLKPLKIQYPQVSFALDNSSLLKNSQVIIIAVKPQDMDALLKEISPFLTSTYLVISIVAGKSISFIENRLGNSLPIIRVMPNMPLMIGEGISVYSISQRVSEEDQKIAREIFGSVGKVLKLEESKLDAVTALSGSGPAYVFYMLEAMIEVGLELGLTEEESKTLSVETLLGTAKMVKKGIDPIWGRRKVTSPKGTTEAALKVLIEKKWKESLIKAIKKAEQRSKELSK